MFYLIGMGLHDEGDIPLRSLRVLEECDYIYLENYTGVLKRLAYYEDLINKSIQILARSEVEERKEFLDYAKRNKVALIVQGDPLSATTHFEILIECRNRGINYEVINASSIFTAVARTGLSLYKFGKTASIPIPENGFKPGSFYDLMLDNLKINAHTLFLLDLKPDRNKYLSIPEALKILLSLDKKKVIKKMIGCARLGAKNELIKYGTPNQLMKVKWGKPPYCLIMPSVLHFIEEEALNLLQ